MMGPRVLTLYPGPKGWAVLRALEWPSIQGSLAGSLNGLKEEIVLGQAKVSPGQGLVL